MIGGMGIDVPFATRYEVTRPGRSPMIVTVSESGHVLRQEWVDDGSHLQHVDTQFPLIVLPPSPKGRKTPFTPRPAYRESLQVEVYRRAELLAWQWYGLYLSRERYVLGAVTIAFLSLTLLVGVLTGFLPMYREWRVLP